MAKTLLFETAFVTVTFVAPGVLTVRGSGDWAFGIEGNVDCGCYEFEQKINIANLDKVKQYNKCLQLF